MNESSAVAEMGDRLARIDMGRKVVAAVPLSVGKLGPHLTMWPGPWPIPKWHLDPSNRLVATIRQRHKRTDRADRQLSDSIGRTVLQTVDQK